MNKKGYMYVFETKKIRKNSKNPPKAKPETTQVFIRDSQLKKKLYQRRFSLLQIKEGTY